MIMTLKFNVNGVLGLFGLILGISQPQIPTRNSHRIFYLTWALIGYLLTQYYTAFLASDLITGSDLKYETEEQLSNSGLNFLTSIFIKLSQECPNENFQCSKLDNFFFNNLKSIEENIYVENTNALKAGKIIDTAILKVRNFSNDNANSFKKFYIITRNNKKIFRSLTVLRNAPSIKKINNLILKLQETGLIINLIKNFDSTNFVNIGEDSDLKLQQLIPVFIFLVICYLVAVIIFLLENLYYYFKLREKLIKFKKYNEKLNKKKNLTTLRSKSNKYFVKNHKNNKLSIIRKTIKKKIY